MEFEKNPPPPSISNVSGGGDNNPDGQDGQTESETIDDISPLSSGRSKHSDSQQHYFSQMENTIKENEIIDPLSPSVTCATQTDIRSNRMMKKTETILSCEHNHGDHHNHQQDDMERRKSSISCESSRRSTLIIETGDELARRLSLTRSVTFDPTKFEATQFEKDDNKTPQNSGESSEDEGGRATPTIRPRTISSTSQNNSLLLKYNFKKPTTTNSSIPNACNYGSCKRSGSPCTHRKWCKICLKMHSMCNPYIDFSYSKASEVMAISKENLHSISPIQNEVSRVIEKPPLSSKSFSMPPAHIRTFDHSRPKSSIDYYRDTFSCPTCYRPWKSVDTLTRNSLCHSSKTQSNFTSSSSLFCDFKVNSSRTVSPERKCFSISPVRVSNIGVENNRKPFSETRIKWSMEADRKCPTCLKPWNSLNGLSKMATDTKANFLLQRSKSPQISKYSWENRTPTDLRVRSSMQFHPNDHQKQSGDHHVSRERMNRRKWQSTEFISERSVSPVKSNKQSEPPDEKDEKEKEVIEESKPKEIKSEFNKNNAEVLTVNEPQKNNYHSQGQMTDRIPDKHKQSLIQANEKINHLNQEVTKLHSQVKSCSDYIKSMEMENAWLKSRLNEQEESLLRRESLIQQLQMRLQELELRPTCGEPCARDRALLKQVLQDLDLMTRDHTIGLENYNIIENQLIDAKRQCQDEVNRAYTLQVEVERLLAEKSIQQERLRMQQWRERELVERERLLRKALDFTPPVFAFDKSSRKQSTSNKNKKRRSSRHRRVSSDSGSSSNSPIDSRRSAKKKDNSKSSKSEKSKPGPSKQEISEPVKRRYNKSYYLEDHVKDLLQNPQQEISHERNEKSSLRQESNSSAQLRAQQGYADSHQNAMSIRHEYDVLKKEKERIENVLFNDVPVGVALPRGRRHHISPLERAQFEDQLKSIEIKLRNIREKIREDPRLNMGVGGYRRY